MIVIIARLAYCWICKLVFAVLVILLIVCFVRAEKMFAEGSIVRHLFSNDVVFGDNCVILAGEKDKVDTRGVSEGYASVQIVDLLSRESTEISLEDCRYEYEVSYAVCKTGTNSYWVVCAAREKDETRISANTLWLLLIEDKKVTEKYYLMNGVKDGDIVRMKNDLAFNLWIVIECNGREDDSLTLIYKAAVKKEVKRVVLSSKCKVFSMDICLSSDERLWLFFTMNGEVSFGDKVILSKRTGVVAIYKSDMSLEMAREFPADKVIDAICDEQYGCYLLASFPSPVLDDHVIGWCKGAPTGFYLARINSLGRFTGGRAINAEIDSASLVLSEDGIMISAMCYGDVSMGFERNYNIDNSDVVIVQCMYSKEFKIMRLKHMEFNRWNEIIGYDIRSGYLCISGRNIPDIEGGKNFKELATILIKMKP